MEHAELMRELNRILNYLFDDQPKKKEDKKTWEFEWPWPQETTQMNEPKDVFKDLLRDYQKPVFQDILTAGNKILLKAPMDFGKTFIGCDYLSSSFFPSFTFSLSTV